MPDITMLDSHFTPYHSSSKNYATFTCSVHSNLAMVRSHCFGSIITDLKIKNKFNPYSQYIVAFAQVFILSFPPPGTRQELRRPGGKALQDLNLACYNKLLPHYTKGTPSQFRIALTAYMSANSGSISPVIYLLFIVSFTVLFTIAEYAILSLEDGSPFISNSSYTVLLFT